VADYGYADGAFSGRPRFILRVDMTLLGTDSANNRSRWRWSLQVVNLDRVTSTWAGGSFPFSVQINGAYVADGGTPNGVFDFRDGALAHAITNGEVWVGHNSDGTKNIGMVGAVANASLFGSAQAVGSVDAPALAKLPGAPAAAGVDQATATSLRFRHGAAAANGAPILQYQAQGTLFSDTAFANPVTLNSSGTVTFTNLTPGTMYRFRARARNAVGWGPWSAVTVDGAVGSTLGTGAPSLQVTPSVNGSSAVVRALPPSGITAVSYYRIERRVAGTTTPVDSRLVNASTENPYTQTGLAPGVTYEWRVRAEIRTYNSPYSAWLTRTQPQPNTNPGDYFDGSTADRPDIDYQWASTVNNSVSRAVARAPLGWRTFAQGVAASGGAGVVARVTGGRSGSFGAQVTFLSDTLAPGFRAGTSLSAIGAVDVAEGGVYFGSIYVAPSRAQVLAAELIWLDAAYAPIGSSSIGDPVLVPALEEPTARLVVQGTAPLGAAHAAVGWVDVLGDGWSPWLGGEHLIMDDAMVSIGALYDWFSGATPDTASWEYSWLGVANASVSMATALNPDDVDPLADPDCAPIPVAPEPPAIADDCIEAVGSWRRYWAIIPQSEVSNWLDLVASITLTTGADAARQVRIRVYQNPDSLDPSEFPADTWAAEQIVSFIPALTVLSLDGVSQRVWAEVDGGEPIGADRLLYGTGGGPASWPVFSCGTAYLISFDVPLDAPEGNLSVDVALTTRML